MIHYYLTDSNGGSIDLGECEDDIEAGEAAMEAMGEGPDCEWDDWTIVDETGRTC